MSDDGFEYESDQESNGSVDADSRRIENLFYEAEDIRMSNPNKSVSILEEAIKDINTDCSSLSWKYKCYIQLVLLTFRLNLHEAFNSFLNEVLTMFERVSRNDAVDGLSTILEGLNFHQAGQSLNAKIEFYERILSRLSNMKSHRLWLSTALNLARLYLETGNSESHLRGLIQDMREHGGSEGYLLDIVALEIQFLTQNSWNGSASVLALIPILEQCHLSGSVGNPRTIAIIKEATGKVFLSREQYDQAYTELYDAFRVYSDSGNPRAPQVLEYALVANLLSWSAINPFDSREARAYLDNTQVRAMQCLRNAFENNRFEEIFGLLETFTNTCKDEFVSSSLESLVHRMRQNFFFKASRAYARISLEKLAQISRTTVEDSKRLAMELIITHNLEGTRISQGCLVAIPKSSNLEQEACFLRDYASFVRNQFLAVQDRLNDIQC